MDGMFLKSYGIVPSNPLRPAFTVIASAFTRRFVRD